MGLDTDWGALMTERTEAADRRLEKSVMLQKQIDALHTNAKLVTQQISDLVNRAQRVDDEISASNKHLRVLGETLDAHMAGEEKRASSMEKRIAALVTGQEQVLRELATANETLVQVRDTRTAWRVLSSFGKSAGGILTAIAAAAAIVIGTIEYVARNGMIDKP